nr:MFS transporter [Mesorhizobium sp. L2C067A000]
MSRVASVYTNPFSPATFAPLRNPTFRSIWLASQVSSLGWLILSQPQDPQSLCAPALAGRSY